jgi:D-alanyl-lipoteichoic acid acyltransferase DltB (MBOAT superfamily)
VAPFWSDPVPAAIAGYVILGWAGLGVLRGAWRARFLALLNIIAFVLIWCSEPKDPASRACFAIYLGIALAHFLLVRRFAKNSGAPAWLAVLFPIAILVAAKYVPAVEAELWRVGRLQGTPRLGAYLVGLSYMAFRLSHLSIEVRNGRVPLPSPAEYFGFAFFLPTIVIGPISPYSTFRESLDSPSRAEFPMARALLRILVGATKFYFLGTLFNRLSYAGLYLDGRPHPPVDLGISAVAYYLYLYFNFSGFTDVAIGAAALLGIRVAENFDRPLLARNVRDFWNRWHITLSSYVRDLLFGPISKGIIRAFGDSARDHAVAAAIFATFIVVGLWHGAAWNYVLFGLLHAGAVTANHYYGILLKKRLGKERFRSYMDSRTLRWVSIGLTNAFVVLSFFCFANTLPTIHEIWETWNR